MVKKQWQDIKYHCIRESKVRLLTNDDNNLDRNKAKTLAKASCRLTTERDSAMSAYKKV